MSQQLTAEMVAALAAKASPGPWRWHGDDNLVCEVFTEILSAGDDGREYGFHSGLIEHHFDPATKEANAALIAAAPAMAHLIETQSEQLAAKDARIARLEAGLRGLLDSIGKDGYFPQAGKPKTDAARAALENSK